MRFEWFFRVGEIGLGGLGEVGMADGRGIWGGSEVAFRSLMEKRTCLPSFVMKGNEMCAEVCRICRQKSSSGWVLPQFLQ